ncbi:hypothetical protein B566_EDAN009523 [Ephemera danica]|nr:hypothetical protein B566_EDAN009523 [Ephemera danica]
MAKYEQKNMDSSRKSRCVRNKTFTTTTVHGDLERYRKIDDEIELSPPLIPNSIESLLEGLSLPADPTNKTDFTVPPWLDMEKLKRGQRFAMQNFFSLCVSEMMSLLLIFTFKGSLSTLVMTNKSSSPFTAFQRYISTLVRLRSWYQDDLWESKSAAGRHITAVRLMHRSVRDRLRDQDSRHIAHQVDSPCCPLLDKIKNDIKAALAMPKSGQCPYNTMEGQVHVNQYYMAITQFAFVGLAVVYPRKFGIKINKKLDQELDAFVHLWAAIAYLLGTEDRFNICIGGLADCREKSAALIETWIKPNLHDIFRNSSTLAEYHINAARWVSQPPYQIFKYSDMEVTLAAPDQLKPKPEVNTLVFGKHFTDHMMKVEFNKVQGGWQTPKIVPFENISLHPAAKVFHYAVELFEGMKAYRGRDDRIRIFRPDRNMERMNVSAMRTELPIFDGDELTKCLCRLISIDQEWVPHSESSSLYIRPTMIGIDPTLGVSSSDNALLFVILCPVGPYFASGFKPVSLLADPKFTRSWPGGCGDQALGLGLQQVLWLFGDDHQLTEVGTMNIFVLLINDNGERELITPPLDGLILPGITRQSIIELALEWNEFKVTERQTLKIPTVDQEDPVHQRVLRTLTDIQYGHVKHPWAICIDEQ